MLPVSVSRNVMTNLNSIQADLYTLGALSVPLQNEAIAAYGLLAKTGLAPERNVPFHQQVVSLGETIGKIRKQYPEYDARLIQVVDETSSLGVGFFYDLWSDSSGSLWSLLILKNHMYADVPIKRADPTVGSAWAHDMDLSKARVHLSFPR